LDANTLTNNPTPANHQTTTNPDCDGGFGDRIVLSHDSFCFNDSVSRRFRDEHLPSWRMDFLVDDVLPTLRRQGVSASDIELMSIVNPARVFGLERQAG